MTQVAYHKLSELLDMVAHVDGLYLESHRPMNMSDHPYHAHPSIEVNFLSDCDMTYSFGSELITVPADSICVFWAARPHRVAEVRGDGWIVNAYVPLHEFWRWSLPEAFVKVVMSGGVAISQARTDWDLTQPRSWARERQHSGKDWERLHLSELKARLLRLSLEGWEVKGTAAGRADMSPVGGNALHHFDAMLRYVAAHYCDPITVDMVADAAGVSKNYAITLFKKFLGTTLKAYVTLLRLHHAKILLRETDRKVLSVAMDSGFQSISSFHEAFARDTGSSPGEYRKLHTSGAA